MPPAPGSIPRIPPAPPTPASARRHEDTDPGIGGTEPPKPLGTLRPTAPRREAPSLLATQVGLGAVRLDAGGNAVFLDPNALLSASRFTVRAGAKAGEIVLVALGEHEIAAVGLPVVTLQPACAEDARAIDLLGR
jgi:hypothetical protein